MRTRISLEAISEGQLRYNDYRKLFQKDLNRCQLGDKGAALILAKYSFEDKERPLLVIGLSNDWKKFIKEELAKGNKMLALGSYEMREQDGQAQLFIEKHKGKVNETVLAKLFNRYPLSRKIPLQFGAYEEAAPTAESQPSTAQAQVKTEKSTRLIKLETAVNRFRSLPKTAIRKRYKLGRAILLLAQQWLSKEAGDYGRSVQKRVVGMAQQMKQALLVYQELIQRKRAQS